MARFQRLTIEEARNLARAELLDRLEVEQRYWHRRLNRKEIAWEDEGYQKFRQIMRLIDPAEAVSDTLAWLQGRGPGRYMDSKPGDDAAGAG